MFVADRLLFLELQKTGGSHIRRLLTQYTDGETSGKHNRLIEKPGDRLILGSIRNPWDWYVSLWAYGVGNKGAIRSRTAKKVDFNYYHRMLPKAMGKNWLSPVEFLTSLTSDIMKPTSDWKKSYLNSSDPVLFQMWIKMLLHPARRYDIGEGFGFSPLSKHSGLLTYRYFRLYTFGDSIFKDKSLAQPDYIQDYDKASNISDGIIRNEQLEKDFVSLMLQAGYELDDTQRSEILNKQSGKTNVSERKSVGHYYDDETIALVADRESYLIEKYQYQAPVLI